MADHLLDQQAAPSAPASGATETWPDNAEATVSRLITMGNDGRSYPLNHINSSVADQLLGTADTYVTGSKLFVPSTGLKVGMVYICRLSLSKTAAGTAAPVWTVRLGTLGTTGDASQWAHTGVAQTAVAETGFYELIATVRTVGASGVLQGTLTVARTGGTAATGLASVPVAQLAGTGADKAWASTQVIGLSINAGATSAWTVTQCIAVLQ
jgi:hypothetical protein